MNREHIKYAIIGIAIILSAYLLGRAYTYKYRSQDTVVVTGLGETEFESDLIVWSGVLTAEAAEAADGYRRIEQSKRKVRDYLAAKGIDAKQVVWKLDDVKLSLIERASADARARAEKIAQNAGTGIGAVASARMGVFQITGANANEEFSAGGSFNTASRHKKARITMRIEYRIK